VLKFVSEWLAAGQWFSPVSDTNKTSCHNIAEILLKVALSTITLYLLVLLRVIYLVTISTSQSVSVFVFLGRRFVQGRRTRYQDKNICISVSTNDNKGTIYHILSVSIFKFRSYYKKCQWKLQDIQEKTIQWHRKHWAKKTKNMSNADPIKTKIRDWNQVLVKGKQFLFHIRHPPGYS
jgi:hypothetical protein